MSTDPIDFRGIEQAMISWLTTSTDCEAYLVEPQASGAPTPAPPAVLVSHLSGPTPLFTPDVRKIPSIMETRTTVTAGGPGSTGVDLRVGFDMTPTPIEVALLAGDDADAGAVKLLAELGAELPAGLTASADPEDTASIIVVGSSSEPMFSLAPRGSNAVTPLLERFPELEAVKSRMTWRAGFRSLGTRGLDSGAALLAKAERSIARILAPRLRAVGWSYAGVLQAQPEIPGDRGEAQAVLDIAMLGMATVAWNLPAARAVGLELNTTP